MNHTGLKHMVSISTFAALMVLGAFIRIPLGPVPVVMTNFFVLLAGYLLGPAAGTSAAALYLFLGSVGLPVFTGGGGVALFLGPTGGYLAGYLPAAALTGILALKNRGRSFVFSLIAFTAGALVIYVPGVLWLRHSTGLSLMASLTAGFFPFLPGDGLKIAAAAAVVRTLGRSVPELFPVFSTRDDT